MSFAVIIHEKGGQPRRQEFDKNEVTIGRVQGNDIVLPKQNVSKRHSRIVVKDGKFIIVDLKSTNGTYVNGRKIASPMVIKETDKIYIGDFILSAEPMDGDNKADAPTEAKAKAPPPPPRRQAPAPAPAPAAPRTAGPPAAATVTNTRRPRNARPSPTSSPQPRSGPAPAGDAPALAPKANAAPAAAAVSAAAPAAVAPPVAAQGALPPPPAALNASAETASQALYEWLNQYLGSLGLQAPAQFEVDTGLDTELAAQLKAAALEALDGISGIDPETVAERAVAEVIGAGPLSDLLGDASLERIFFNGPRQAWVTRGGQTTQHATRFSSPSAMVACAKRVLRGRGIAVEPEAAFADGVIQDGRRIHVAFGKVGGPFITIERVDDSEITLDAFVNQDVLSDSMATYLTHAMRLGRVIIVASNDVETRFNFISALLGALEAHVRVIAIESGARLAVKNEQSLVLSGGESRAELIRNALKMCPDRLVVADARGPETLEALTSMGSAVNGGILGVDAESPDDALIRLARNSSVAQGIEAADIEGLLNDRADMLVQVLRFADGRTRVTQIMDIDGEINEVFGGFQKFQGHGFVPRWYENARSLGHELNTEIFG